MNLNSLSHSLIQNQDRSSWIDDPFDLKGEVKGVTMISHNRNLSDYAERLVSIYAEYDIDNYYLLISELPESEQNELTRLYMESTDRDTSECVYGEDFTINSDYTCALLAMLKNDCEETRERFAYVTRKNIIKYYTNSLQEVLDDACNSYLILTNNDNEMYAHQDTNSGETYWSRY